VLVGQFEKPSKVVALVNAVFDRASTILGNLSGVCGSCSISCRSIGVLPDSSRWVMLVSGVDDDWRDAEIDRSGRQAVAHTVQADQLAGRRLEAGVEASDFAKPAVELGFLDAVPQVGDDVD
jgi:hypothetical protein